MRTNEWAMVDAMMLAARGGGRARARRTRPAAVREDAARYEDEGSARQARGAVPVGADAWWSVSLSVPVRDGVPDARLALLHLERHGPVAGGSPRVPSADLIVPGAEVEALAALLAGVAAQARRDAVLGPVSVPVPPR